MVCVGSTPAGTAICRLNLGVMMLETTTEKDLIIARQNSQIEEMIHFMAHLDLSETICEKMAKENL